MPISMLHIFEIVKIVYVETIMISKKHANWEH